MKFGSPKMLKTFLTDYVVAKGFPHKFKANCKTHLLAICANGCPWRLWASYMQNENNIQIKSLNTKHKCVGEF